MIVSVIVSVSSVQLPFASAVSVRVTVPAVLSAALGVYTGFKIVLLLKPPVPDVVHSSPS